MCASPDVFHVLHIRFTFFSIPTNSWVCLKNIRWSQRSLNEPKTQMHYCALDLQGGFCLLGVLCLGPSLCPTVQIQPGAAPHVVAPWSFVEGCFSRSSPMAVEVCWATTFCGRFTRLLFSQARSRLLGEKWCSAFLLIIWVYAVTSEKQMKACLNEATVNTIH